MSTADQVVHIVCGWVEKAENDLTTAVHTLMITQHCPTDAVCFHAQQCVEKYLKALLVLRQTPFPKVHSVSALLALLPAPARPSLSAGEQERLADYAVVARYPGDYEPISRAEARRAVAIARRVRREVRRLLPVRARRRQRA
jgi:HEPN domain-containing protein